jgi:type I restriction enzyme S subunit
MGRFKYVLKTAKMLSNQGYERTRRIPAESTLFVCIGSTIGKVGIASKELATNQQINAIIPHCQVDSQYLYYAVSTLSSFVREQAGAQAVPLVNKSEFSAFEIFLPLLGEQRRIASILQDADNVVASLERLIAKKQAIKQGIMQQFLTGRTRFPGFTDPWREVRLRDEGSTYGGLTGKTKDDFGTGSAAFVTFMEVMAGPRLLGQRLERVRVRSNERQNRVQRGDVLFNGSSETPEEVALAAVVDFEPHATTYLNSFCFGYRLKGSDLIDPAYLAYFFRSDTGRVLVASLAQGATRYNIAKTKLLDLSPVLPPVNEQRAIVASLGDCEDEIKAMARRLAKARAIKQGMMQELLTGRTRLHAAEVAA